MVDLCITREWKQHCAVKDLHELTSLSEASSSHILSLETLYICISLVSLSYMPEVDSSHILHVFCMWHLCQSAWIINYHRFYKRQPRKNIWKWIKIYVRGSGRKPQTATIKITPMQCKVYLEVYIYIFIIMVGLQFDTVMTLGHPLSLLDFASSFTWCM